MVFCKKKKLFIFREGERRERNISDQGKYRSVASHTPPTWPTTQACALAGKQTGANSLFSRENERLPYDRHSQLYSDVFSGIGERAWGHTPRGCVVSPTALPVVCHGASTGCPGRFFQLHLLMSYKAREKTALKNVNFQIPPVIWQLLLELKSHSGTLEWVTLNFFLFLLGFASGSERKKTSEEKQNSRREG